MRWRWWDSNRNDTWKGYRRFVEHMTFLKKFLYFLNSIRIIFVGRENFCKDRKSDNSSNYARHDTSLETIRGINFYAYLCFPSFDNVRKERIETLKTFLFLKRSNTKFVKYDASSYIYIYIYHTNPWRIVDTKKTNNTVMYIITLGEIFVTSKYLKKKKEYLHQKNTN